MSSLQLFCGAHNANKEQCLVLVVMGLCFSFSFAAKSRSISLPLDLEAQISSMLSTSALNSLSRSNPNYRSSSRSSRPAAPINPWDYKNIIEKLQVLGSLGRGAESTQKCIDDLSFIILLFIFCVCVGVQDIINTLEERLKPLVNAELSVLVDVLHQPELLFLEGTDARQRCESGGFISK